MFAKRRKDSSMLYIRMWKEYNPHSKNNNSNSDISSKYGISEQRNGYKGSMRLTVRSFSTNDVGTYHCVSTNSLGRAEGTLRLYGKYKTCEIRQFCWFRQNLDCPNIKIACLTRIVFLWKCWFYETYLRELNEFLSFFQTANFKISVK